MPLRNRILTCRAWLVAVRRIVILLAFCGASPWAASQTYLSAATTYTWIDPAGHTNVTWSGLAQCNGSGGSATDDDITVLLNLGFTFNWAGTSQTQNRIASNGRVTFGNTYCNDWNRDPFPDADQNNAIRVYGIDLDPRASGNGTTCPTATCHVRYASIGTAPNRQFVVTYTRVPEFNRGGSYFNLQLIIEEDGDFIMQYGASVAGSGYAAQRGYQIDTSDYSAVAGAAPASGTAHRWYMPNPTVEYRMEEGSWSGAGAVVDTSGAYAGTALGSAQTTSGGRVCRGANIPNNTSTATIDAINTGMDVDTMIGNRSGIITFWYNSTLAWSSGDRQLFDATIAANTWFFLVKRSTGQLEFVVNDSGANTSSATSAHAFGAGTWVHIAVSWNMTTTVANNRLRIYVNGVLTNSTALTRTNPLNTGIGSLYIGDNRSTFVGANGTGNSANGVIDEFRVYAAQEGGIGIVRRDMNQTRTCTLTIGSFDINVGAATGSTCAQKSITLTARDTGGSTMTSYTGTVNLSTSTSRGDWAVVTANGTADDGAATYTFVAADNGVVTLGLTHQLAQQLTLTAVDSVTPSTSTTSSAISFSDNTFVFTEDLSSRISGSDIAVAGRAHDFRATLYRRDPPTSSNCSVATSYNGSKALKAWITRAGTDPGGAAPSISAISLGNSQPGSNNLTLSFINGVASFNLATTDVGKFALNLRDDTTANLTAAITGASNDLTVRPFGLVISGIARGATANPATSSATGSVFTQAGESFQATVGAYRHSAAADVDDNGELDVAATQAQAAAGGLAPSYAYATTLSATAPYYPSTGTLGTLSNGSLLAGSFSGGTTTASTLSYSEVGSFSLAGSVSTYLGTAGLSLTATPFTAAGAQSAVVGRFTPFDFGLSFNTPVFTPGCATATRFTYIGQTFNYATALVITLTARNKARGTTQNYTGTWWKLSNATLTSRTYAAASGTLDSSCVPATTSDPVLAETGGAPGTGTLTFSGGSGLRFTRAAPVAPFNADIALTINVIDSDGVAYASNPARFGTATSGNGIAFSGSGKAMRWGRLKLANAIGSEFANLSMPVEAQYYTGTTFVLNADDGCTGFAKSAVMFSNWQRNLAACETFLSTVVSSVTLSAGKTSLALTKPGAGNTGSVDLTPGLASSDSGVACVSASSSASPGSAAGVALSHLQSNWDPLTPSQYNKNPSAKAVFGMPNVPKELIYQRENY